MRRGLFRSLVAVSSAWALLGSNAAAMDRVRAVTGTDDAVTKYGLSGAGVTVAILDRGIDWTHPDFRNPDDTTRIRWLLDASGQNWCEPGNPAAAEYSAADIDAALAAGAGLGVRDGMDAVGHGTVTAGIAVGNGRAAAGGKYRGIAPEADLIVVKLTSEGAQAHGSQPAEVPFNGCVDDALDWLDQKLGSTPAVALINFGTQWGPIDGTSAISRKIDQVFGEHRPGRIMVLASGDDGAADNHARLSYMQGVDTEQPFVKSGPGPTSLSAWYSGPEAVISLVLPSGAVVGPLARGVQPLPAGNQQNGVILFHFAPGTEFYPWQSTSGNTAVRVGMVGHTGTLALRVRGVAPGTGFIDVYGDAEPGGLLTFPQNLYPGRLSDFSSTRSAIVAGAYVARTDWLDVDAQPRSNHDGNVDDLWEGSASGPTRDGRVFGVDVVTPGHNVFASYGRTSWWGTFRGNLIEDGDGWYGSHGATSGASPILLGAVALMLEVEPSLTAAQVRSILRSTARQDSHTGSVPNPPWGYGKLDVLAAVDALHPGYLQVLGSLRLFANEILERIQRVAIRILGGD